MKKEEIFEKFDFQPGDKVYIIRCRDTPNGGSMQRMNIGFTFIELLGIASMLKEEIILQWKGVITPEHIDRQLSKEPVTE